MGERAHRPVGLGAGGRRGLAQGSEPAIPAVVRRSRGGPPHGQDAYRALPDAHRRHVPLARRRFRRGHGHARRTVIPEGRASYRCTRRAGGIPVGHRCARVDLLHRPGPGGHGARARFRSAAGGDCVARAHGAQRLRPPVPVAGRPPFRRRRQPHRGAAPRAAPQRRRDGVPRPEHIGAARGPMGLPLEHAPTLSPRRGEHRGPRRRGASGQHGDAPAAADRVSHQPAAADDDTGDSGRNGQHRHERSDPRDAGHPQARGVDAEPGVLRTAAPAALDLERAPVPAQLRRDPRREAPATPRLGRSGLRSGARGRQQPRHPGHPRRRLAPS